MVYTMERIYEKKYIYKFISLLCKIKAI